MTSNYLQQRIDRQVYGEFVANILKKPSYLSGEYVLQKYGILTESVFGFTCVTRKKTREYSNKLGSYIYSNIKDGLFCGYNIFNKSGFEIKEAIKSKALFDYLYFKLRNVPEVNLEVVESLRLNLDNITKKDFEDWQESDKKRAMKTLVIHPKDYTKKFHLPKRRSIFPKSARTSLNFSTKKSGQRVSVK